MTTDTGADIKALEERLMEGLEQCPEWGGNFGHGHVWKRPDGVRARCGGPAMCRECAKDLARSRAPDFSRGNIRLLLDALASAIAERDEARAATERMEAQRDAAQFAARNGHSLAEDSIYAIRELLNAHNVPLSAFIDDHVGNVIVQRNSALARLEEAKAVLGPFGKYLDTAAFDLDNKGEPLPDDQGMGWVYLTVGDFRHARAFLHQGGSDAR